MYLRNLIRIERYTADECANMSKIVQDAVKFGSTLLDTSTFNLAKLNEELKPYNKQLIYKTDEELWKVFQDSNAKRPSHVLLQWMPLLYDIYFADYYNKGKGVKKQALMQWM